VQALETHIRRELGDRRYDSLREALDNLITTDEGN
jgi:hypothetical protein